MSSKGKRSSILKKQNNEYDDTAPSTSSNTYKGPKKIGFHRKMSIKEFTIGENTETIWGNSYEVSADGTSPRVVCDDTHTLNANSSSSGSNHHPETALLQEENKENVTLVPDPRLGPMQDVSVRTSPNNTTSASNSWDLSITIADDEKRRMRSESLLNGSQSLNMTERLLMEPTQLPLSSKRRSSSEVLAMDVSPMKPPVTVSAASRSPRKMMYYNPKQGLTVQINDVPLDQALDQPAAREKSAIFDRSNKRSMPCDRSETWNSHPQAMFQLSALRPSNGGLTDMSSDFDNTIAITETVEKLLKADANLTLTVPTNMELDESATVTDVKLPTNALARARPSFLPSQTRQQDISQDEEEHIESYKVPATTANASNPPAVRQLNETESMERTSVVPTISFGGNLSLSFEDVQQPLVNKSGSVSRGTRGDFKTLSMNLGLSLDSPEPVNAGRQQILRPTHPFALFATASKAEPPKRTLLEEAHFERSAISRQTMHTPTEMDETRVNEATVVKSKHSNLAPISMETVTKEPAPSRSYRATVYETKDMIDDDERQPLGTSGQRATDVHRETMELSNHSLSAIKTNAQPVDSSVLHSTRRTVYAQQPMDESIVEQPGRASRDLKRTTKHDRMTMLETSPAAARGRNTLYPNEPMLEDRDEESETKIMSQCTATVSRNPRQTILNNDSMVLDNPEARASTITCGIYGENLDAVSIHAESETHVMDLTLATRTPKHAQHEPGNAKADNRSRPTTMVMEECMRLTEVYAPQHPEMQRNVHATIPMDEEEQYYVATGRDKDVDQQKHGMFKSRIATYQSIAMDETEIAETNCNDTKHGIDLSSKEKIHHTRPTIHQVEAMEVTNARNGLVTGESGLVNPNPVTRKADERSMFDDGANSNEARVSQRSRHSIYQPQDMEQTLPSTSGMESPKERATVQPTRSTLRKSILQKIIRQTPVEDMEGISLLTDDDDLRAMQANEPSITKPNRATMHFIDDAAQTMQETMVATSIDHLAQEAPMDLKHDRAINRQTMYEAQAMERETNIMSSAFRGSSKMVDTREPSYGEPIVQMNSKQDRPIQRQTMNQAVAMEEETSSYQPLAMVRGVCELCDEEPIVESAHDRPTDRQTIYDMHAMREEADIAASSYRTSTKIFTSEERTEPIASVNSKQDRPKNRQTMCEPIAMEEETSSYQPLAMVDEDAIVEIPEHARPADRQSIYAMQAMREEADTVSSGYRAVTTATEKHTGYDEPIVPMNSKEDHAKRHRQTIYEARAMEEETSIMPIVHRMAHSGNENEAESAQRSSSLTSLQRKSSVCMEETVALLPVRRIERNDIPEDNLGQSPNLRPQRKRETIYPTDDTMEITLSAVQSEAAEKQRRLASRQTKFHPAVMETTVMPDDLPAASRDGDGAFKKPPTHYLPNNPMDKSTVFQQEQLAHDTPVSVKRETSRRPRQTILLAQDMDIEDSVEHTMEGRVKKEESFAFPKLVRETTEDCVLRCAPAAKMVRGRAGFSDAIGEPYGMLSRSTTIGMDKSSIGYPHTINGVTRDEERQQQHQQHPYHAQDRTHSASIYQESIDISISRSLLPTEPPPIDSISGYYVSMQDVTVPLTKAKQLAASTEDNASVSVIRHGSTTMAPEPLHSVTVAETASDDEFHDAEDELVNDPLSLTKSRHLLQSMKFVDVEQMERTLVATSKRVHANVRTTVSSMVDGLARDPLHLTLCQQQQRQEENPQSLTPQGPLMKKKRVSNSPASTTATAVPVMQSLDDSPEESNEAGAAEQYDPSAGEPIPVSKATPQLADGRRSVINDMSVFVIDDDDDLLDDESQLPSLTEEQLMAQLNQRENATNDESPSVKRFFRPPNDLSYYRDFANLTLNEWYEEEQEQEQEQEEQPGGPVEENVIADCITISDDSVTAPMANLTVAQRRSSTSEGGVLNSTIADEFMEELMAKLPPKTKHPCCGSNSDCLCRLRRQLERRRKADEREWQLFDKQFASIVESAPQGHVSPSAFEQRFEELCWQLGDLEQDLSSMLETAITIGKGSEKKSAEGNTEERVELHSWRRSGGATFPEIPNVVFLYENLRRCLQEQPRVDDSPPAGAHLPRVPHITQLVANKLATEHEGSGWCLDLSEEALFDHLMFRHRTIPSFHVSVQLQPAHTEQPGSTRKTTRPGVPREEDRYIERIQVESTDTFEAVFLSPMRYLLHVEFMRLTMETTEQTLRSKYRTVGSLMGVWRHFSELYECASRNVHQLLTIVENGDAMLTYDRKTEQFCVKKWFQRHQSTATGDRLTSNVLQVHFDTINSIAPSGVRFNRPFPDAHVLLSSVAGGPTKDHCTGTMFLECLLWKILKLYEQPCVAANAGGMI